MNETTQIAATRIRTGTAGLDKILGGGLTPNRLYLVEGTPGAGKTTLALKFLLEGAAAGEAGLYITLSETETELQAVARSHGWSLDGLTLFELVTEEAFAPDFEQTLLHPSDVELGETVRGVIARVEATDPQARRARQPVGAAPAGAEPAALPPPDPGAQALLRQAQLHRARARRPLRGARRPAAPLHRARRGLAGADHQRFRRRAAAAPGREDAGPALQRRLSRLHYREGRPAGLSAPRLGRSPPVVLPRSRRHRAGGARRPARRRPRARNQRAADRPGGRRQDHDGGALHDRGARAGAAGGVFPVRRAARDADAALRGARHGSGALRRERAADDPADRPGRALPRRVRRRGAGGRGGGRGPLRRDRQPERLPARDAERQLPGPADARAA